MMTWEEEVRGFIEAANRAGVRMLMVGGGAVNWHGYKRHSADVDFWLQRTESNLTKLIEALRIIGYELDRFPSVVEEGLRNVSLKFSPHDLDVELITRFDVGKSFDEAYASSIRVTRPDSPLHYWQVLAYDDLVTSKVKAGRPKDLLDIQELQRIRKGKA